MSSRLIGRISLLRVVMRKQVIHYILSCVQHQPSAVPSKPLGGFQGALKQESLPPAAAAAAAAPEGPAKYNSMAPPVSAYTAEYALARASAAMEGNRQQQVYTHPLPSQQTHVVRGLDGVRLKLL